jgi:hypothetical protein
MLLSPIFFFIPFLPLYECGMRRKTIFSNTLSKKRKRKLLFFLFFCGTRGDF